MPISPIPTWLARGYILLFALLPWSAEWSFGAWTLQFPSEPLIVLLGLGLCGVLAKEPLKYGRTLLDNRLFLWTGLWMVWMALSAVFSSMPLVSWKYWVAEVGQWWVFAAGIALFPGLWRKVIPVYAVSMGGMVLYTLGHHALYHFRPDQSLLAPMPFFPDHTLYAAVLALLLPWLFWYGKRRQQSFLLVLYALGGWLAYCRAATISVGLETLAFVGLYFQPYRRWFVWAVLVLLGTVFLFRAPLRAAMERTLAGDVSIRERVNRYSCATRMAIDRPWTGFGPGTFQFQYFRYQRPADMTRISVQEPLPGRNPATYGRGGGAHSEYWQTLAETGWLGLLLYSAWVFAFFRIALGGFLRAENKENQRVLLLCLLSFLSFTLHGLVNNMLHDGRVAALVWGQAALLHSLIVAGRAFKV